MSSLSGACQESYPRAYPLITQLQVLCEVEDGYKILQKSTPDQRNDLYNTSLHWDKRLNIMSTSYSTYSSTLAVRRSLLTTVGMTAEVSYNWLNLSQTMRKIGRYESARYALRQAESIGGLGQGGGLGQDLILIEECLILKNEGNINKALMLLEPVEINAFHLLAEYKKYFTEVKGATGGTGGGGSAAVDPNFRQVYKCTSIYTSYIINYMYLSVYMRQYIYLNLSVYMYRYLLMSILSIQYFQYYDLTYAIHIHVHIYTIIYTCFECIGIDRF